MRIVIIGAGTTGRNLAGILTGMKHDLVLVDRDADKLAEIEAEFDILTVLGDGAQPAVLEKAGIAGSDMLLAVTGRDETNILACIYAKAAKVPRKVARVLHTGDAGKQRWNLEQLGVDLLVSQNDESARDFFDILAHPGALETLTLLDTRMLAIGARVAPDSDLTGVALSSLGEAFALLSNIRFIALLRQGKLVIPRGDTVFREGDEVYVVLPPENADDFLDWVCPSRPVINRTILAGGGDLGLSLARLLEKNSRQEVVLIERDGRRAEYCAKTLDRTRVLCGDAGKREMLEEAGIGPGSAYAAVTGEDELNIVSCVLAKTMEASWTVAQVSKPEYVPIIRHMRLLDRVASPYLSMINAILHHMREGNTYAASLLQQLPGELLNVVLSGKNSWTGRSLSDTPPLPGAVVAMVQRDSAAYIPTGKFVLEKGDRLLLFVEPGAGARVASLFKE